MNQLLNGLQDATNFAYTENGALTHRTTKSALLDLFAMGAAMRERSDADVINIFKNALIENPSYALKCLFYLRDCRGGQGERRFFRVCMKWLANNYSDEARRNLAHIPLYGRWDDLYVFVGTPLEADALQVIKDQLALDVQCKTPSLLAKWLKSENTSSAESRKLAHRTREFIGMTHKQYRKTLSILRERINVLETLMSAGKWDEIEFDKIPSKAGLVYRNAFARHDIERAQSEKAIQTYAEFAKDTTKKVNAKTLYPYECVNEAYLVRNRGLDTTDRLMANKRWDSLTDYFNKATLNALAVVDTSGSMTRYNDAAAPINVAISLGMYCAERAGGPFANHYISFASRPQLIKVDGVDFVDKVERIYRTNLVDNTNIEGVFDLLLNTAMTTGCSQADMPENIIIISDMEFDQCAKPDPWWGRNTTAFTTFNRGNADTLLEGIAKKWASYGYEMPKLIFWNVNARQENIPMLGVNNISYVSGFSPSIFETIISGKSGFDLMMEKLNSERYACIK